jgi:hypothetical protein
MPIPFRNAKTPPVLSDGGARLQALLDVVRADLASGSGLLVSETGLAVQSLWDRTQDLVAMRKSRPRDVEAAALPYLRMTGIVLGAWMWCRMIAALPKGHPLEAGKQAAAEYYRSYCLPEAQLWALRSRIGASVIDPPGVISRT